MTILTPYDLTRTHILVFVTKSLHNESHTAHVQKALTQLNGYVNAYYACALLTSLCNEFVTKTRMWVHDSCIIFVWELPFPLCNYCIIRNQQSIWLHVMPAFKLTHLMSCRLDSTSILRVFLFFLFSRLEDENLLKNLIV